MTAKTIHTLWPTHRVHIPAFFGALILAPLAFAAMSFILVIPVFAVFFGALPYLVFGGPALFWALSQGIRKPTELAMVGFCANAVFVVISASYVAATTPRELDAYLGLFAGFGSIFAPLWGLTFGHLYRWLAH